MKFDVALGLLLGGLLAALSIAANIRRGDPHLVTMYPGLIYAIVLPLGIYLLMRRMRGVMNQEDLTWAGMRLTFAAAAIFAVAMVVFTWWWFPMASLPLMAFSFFGTLFGTIVFGVVASLLAARVVRGSARA